MKLEHVAINIPEPAAAAQWWAENLGMRIVVAGKESPFAHFIVDSDNTSMMEFYNNPAAPLPDYAAIDPFNLHIAFSSDDIAADRARLVSAGAAAVNEVTPTPAGDQLCFLRDPWQVPFQLVQRKKPMLG
ncbi:MAG: VOC family protein [Caldilineaceae bacterium]|nr:VOC family protein [Caldilineaceae bacterium]